MLFQIQSAASIGCFRFSMFHSCKYFRIIFPNSDTRKLEILKFRYMYIHIVLFLLSERTAEIVT